MQKNKETIIKLQVLKSNEKSIQSVQNAQAKAQEQTKQKVQGR